MKKLIAVMLCFAFIFLCACNKDGEEPTTDYREYVNLNDYTGIPRETKADWFEDKTVNQNTQATEAGSPAVKSDLPEGFPAIPEGTSNISIKKYKAEDSDNRYQSDWVQVQFSAPMHSIYQFSRDLVSAGYKGNAIYISSQDGYYEYYSEGWHGAWRNDKHLIRIDSWFKEIDGSFGLTLDIVECVKGTYPELAALMPIFDGYTAASGIYCEILDDGNLVQHEFDGTFHKKWLVRYTQENAVVGVTREQFDDYIEELKAAGFVGEIYYVKIDGCEAYGFDCLRKEDGLFVSFILNETLSTMELVYANQASL